MILHLVQSSWNPFSVPSSQRGGCTAATNMEKHEVQHEERALHHEQHVEIELHHDKVAPEAIGGLQSDLPRGYYRSPR